MLKITSCLLFTSFVTAEEKFLTDAVVMDNGQEIEKEPEANLLYKEDSLVGGKSKLKDISEADETTTLRFESYKALINARENNKYEKLVPVKYSQQVIAGVKYTIIYDTGNDKQIEVTVIQPLPNTNADPEIQNIVDYEDPSHSGATKMVCMSAFATLAAMASLY